MLQICALMLLIGLGAINLILEPRDLIAGGMYAGMGMLQLIWLLVGSSVQQMLNRSCGKWRSKPSSLLMHCPSALACMSNVLFLAPIASLILIGLMNIFVSSESFM